MSASRGRANVLAHPSECLSLAMDGHCDAVGWEPSTASEPDIRTLAPQVDFGLMMVSVEQYTRKMPRLNDSSKGVLVNHKYQHSFHSQNVFRVVE